MLTEDLVYKDRALVFHRFNGQLIIIEQGNITVIDALLTRRYFQHCPQQDPT